MTGDTRHSTEEPVLQLRGLVLSRLGLAELRVDQWLIGHIIRPSVSSGAYM